MTGRLRGLGIVLGLIGLAFIAAGGYAFLRTQEGAASLRDFSAAQNVRLAYDDEGRLLDRGTVEGAEAITALLADEWGYPVVASELDPEDPIVNTGSEYMYQMATVAYHTLNGVQTVILEEPVEYQGETFAAGTYEVPVDGRYWADFDREHPLDGPARTQAWSGVAHALIAELGIGTVTASTLQLGLAVAGLFGAVGATLIVAGAGLVWAVRPVEEKVRALRPATVAG